MLEEVISLGYPGFQKTMKPETYRIAALHRIAANDRKRDDYTAPSKSTLAPEDNLLQHRSQNTLHISLTNSSSGIARLDKHLDGGFLGLQGVTASGQLNGCIDGTQHLVAGNRAFEGCRAVSTAQV
jgi:hypothetical protein